ncbi:MAG: FecR family protein [Bacteroidota bacterium]
MDKIITSYFQGNISLEDQHKLQQWLEEDEANPVILEQMEKYWNQGALNFPEQKDRVLGRIKSAMSRQPEVAVKKQGRMIEFRSILKYAAVITMASLLSIYLYTSFGPSDKVHAINYIEKATESGQKITTLLPDGTKVKLNAGSKIIVPEIFSGHTREVRLEGEAFFEVTHNPEKPFIVHFGDQQVRVLGTSFNINAYKVNEQNTVAVQTGKVEVKRGDEKVNLNPNEAVVLNGAPLSVVRVEDPSLYFGWVDNQLTFNKATLDEAMETISKWYGVEVEINRRGTIDSLYTARHSNPTLKEVMEILSFTFNLKYEIKENQLIIK